jgi:hypothetical protein
MSMAKAEIGRPSMPRRLIALLLFALAAGSAPALAQPARPAPIQPTGAQTESDAYTRYELLAPGSNAFRIIYEVTAATPGAAAYFNPIRKGSVAADERVSDRATGRPLVFAVVSGAKARETGLPDADLATDYIRVTLARPVPADGGGGRVLIEKTYTDPKSYFVDGEDIVFSRPLGIKRNAVVLPAGYRLVACNYPAQVLQEPDGRIKIAFLNVTPAEAPLVLRARKGLIVGTGPSSQADKLDERAHQNRDIVYFLQPPETHAFRLYHDYTETRPGVGTYVNVVRTGSAASDPSARNIDTGDVLKATQLKGEAIAKADLPKEDLPPITPDAEVVVFRFPPVPAGGSTRLRMSETYTDAKSYLLVGDELVFHRSFGRPANAVVLPQGWVLTNSSIPAVVSETPEGLTRLDFLNPRPDEVDVLITARRLGQDEIQQNRPER